MNEGVTYIKSSGNIFADLNIEHPEDELAKAQLAHHVRLLIREQNLTHAKAAQVFGVEPSQVTDLIGGKVSAFTYDHLLRFLNALECDVKIIVEPRNADHIYGKTLVATT